MTTVRVRLIKEGNCGGGEGRREEGLIGKRRKGKWSTGATKDNDKLKTSTLIFPYVG